MYHFFITATLALSSACAIAQSSPPAAVQPAGTLKNVSGDVRVVGTDYEERKVQPGDFIAPSERIVTGPDSNASLVLRDGTVMSLGARTNVDFRKFVFDAQTQQGSLVVSLVRGSFRMITGLIGKADPRAIAISTPTASLGIRGTDFIVTVDEVQQ
jgi:hypothetical protein